MAANPPACERFEPLLEHGGVRVERIVSHGQTTPPDRPYCQEWDEWVTIVAGAARLRLADRADEVVLAPGDHLMIPAGVAHRVTYTADPTIWLALHFEART